MKLRYRSGWVRWGSLKSTWPRPRNLNIQPIPGIASNLAVRFSYVVTNSGPNFSDQIRACLSSSLIFAQTFSISGRPPIRISSSMSPNHFLNALAFLLLWISRALSNNERLFLWAFLHIYSSNGGTEIVKDREEWVESAKLLWPLSYRSSWYYFSSASQYSMLLSSWLFNQTGSSEFTYPSIRSEVSRGTSLWHV